MKFLKFFILFITLLNILPVSCSDNYNIPENTVLYDYVSQAFNAYRSKNYPTAIKNFSKALNIHKTPDGYLYRGYSYIHTKQYDLAEKDFITTIALCQYNNDELCKRYSFFAYDMLNLLEIYKNKL